MPYWDIVGRAFRISWHHRYLWLIAFFSGESGGGGSFSYSNGNQFNLRPGEAGRLGTPDFGAVQSQVVAWLQANAGLIAVLVLLWLVLVVGFFLLGGACEAALVRASAEHDAERPFDLRAAWQAGTGRMWVIVRLRLLLLALGLPVAILFGGLIVGALIEGFGGHAGAAVAFVLGALLVGLLSLPYVVYLSFLDRFGARAAVLELVEARASLARAHHLLFKRPGRSLVVWLLSIAVSIGAGFVVGIVAAIVVLPLLGVGYFAAAGAVSWLWVALIAAIALPVLVVVSAFLSALLSTYWTLAFRRLDVEYPPPYAYAPPQAPAT